MLATLHEVRRQPARSLAIRANDTEARVSAVFLRWFLLEAIPAAGLPITRVELWEVQAEQPLDLSGARLEFTLLLANCRLLGGLVLTDATVCGLELVGGRLLEIRADRLTASGSVLIRAPTDDPSYRHNQPASDTIVVPGQIFLSGAKIRGNLDLRGCQLGTALDPGPDQVALLADGMQVEGNLLLSTGFAATGEIRLNGSTVSRNLDCLGARLHNPGGYSLSAAGAHVIGSVRLCAAPEVDATVRPVPFRSIGTLRLAGAKIDGFLDCSGGCFVATAFWVPGWSPATRAGNDLNALHADGVQVGASVYLTDGFHARGIVRLVTARIDNDLSCARGFFDFPGEEALYADGISVSRAMFLTDGATTNGVLRLIQASLTQGLFVERAVFDLTPTFRDWLGTNNMTAQDLAERVGSRALCGIYAASAEVGGTFFWQQITRLAQPRQSRLFLHLTGSKAGAIEDDAPSWQVLDDFDLTDCEDP